MSVTVGVSYAAINTREKLRGGIGKTKVRRYWPGKAPEWAEKGEEDDTYFDVFGKALKKADELRFPKENDSRLMRLVRNRTENRDKADHRRVRHEAEVISTKEEEESSNQETREVDDQEALEERRRQIKENNLKKSQEEAELLPVEEEEEGEEFEYETDSEDAVIGFTIRKPIFVPESERDTVVERKRLEAQEKALVELAKKKLETRKTETKQIVVEEARKYQEIQKNILLEEENIGDVDTDDEVNEAEEYEAWKTRELARIKREKNARAVMLREKEIIEKLRNMTEEERKVLKTLSSAQPKKKIKFLQRYYHKGAFFQEAGSDETNDILQHDYSAPTGEDKFDKSKLRQVLQVKMFGHRGRTKWTNLLSEDTTGKGNLLTFNVPLCKIYKRKIVGMDDSDTIAKPKGSKKIKDWEYCTAY